MLEEIQYETGTLAEVQFPLAWKTNTDGECGSGVRAMKVDIERLTQAEE